MTTKPTRLRRLSRFLVFGAGIKAMILVSAYCLATDALHGASLAFV